MNYIEIKIHKTEFDDNFLLLYNNKTLLVGFLVKEILECLQKDINSIDDIRKIINNKYNIAIDDSSINITKNKLDSFLNKKVNSGFIRVFKLLNPNKINSKIFGILFEKNVFYPLFLFTLSVNMYFFYTLENNILNAEQTIIWLFCTITLLILHEIGHSLSAQKFKLNCDEIGVGIYLIFPVFYINLGEAWKLNKSKRIIINLSGIYFQLLIGVVLIILNYFFESKLFIHVFFTNFIVVLLNFNPFIKFDGYWILSDIVNMKNLSKKSNDVIKNFLILNLDFVQNKFWLNIYSFLKFLFLIFILFYVIQLLIDIVSKISNNNTLSFYDYLFILILFTIIIKKTRKK